MWKKLKICNNCDIVSYGGYILATVLLWNMFYVDNSIEMQHDPTVATIPIVDTDKIRSTFLLRHNEKELQSHEVVQVEDTPSTTSTDSTTTTVTNTSTKTVLSTSKSTTTTCKNVAEDDKMPTDISKSGKIIDPRQPKFLIIGVMKCGTSATKAFLEHHPDLNNARQEAYFFNNDNKYRTMGYEWYFNLFPKSKPNVLNYEKSPTYYKSVKAQPRIKAMNETIKIVNIVCDNVRRTLSRYLHIESNVKSKKFPRTRLTAIGGTLDGFTEKLRKTIKNFKSFLDEIRRKEGNGSLDGLMQALYRRFKRRQRPFGISATKDPIELILSDGFYAIFHQNWQAFFPDKQLIVIDGNQFLTEPWKPLKKLQQFVGVQEFINEDNFVIPESGLPCFRENKNDHPACLKSTKGRSTHYRFPKDVTKQLHDFFRPFDLYFSRQTLHRKAFDWNFGFDD